MEFRGRALGRCSFLSFFSGEILATQADSFFGVDEDGRPSEILSRLHNPAKFLPYFEKVNCWLWVGCSICESVTRGIQSLPEDKDVASAGCHTPELLGNPPLR
jgi:hypothetical protein